MEVLRVAADAAISELHNGRIPPQRHQHKSWRHHPGKACVYGESLASGSVGSGLACRVADGMEFVRPVSRTGMHARPLAFTADSSAAQGIDDSRPFLQILREALPPLRIVKRQLNDRRHAMRRHSSDQATPLLRPERIVL
jgi:hypothetical protein